MDATHTYNILSGQCQTAYSHTHTLIRAHNKMVGIILINPNNFMKPFIVLNLKANILCRERETRETSCSKTKPKCCVLKYENGNFRNVSQNYKMNIQDMCVVPTMCSYPVHFFSLCWTLNTEHRSNNVHCSCLLLVRFS